MTETEILKALPTIAYGGHACMNCKYKISEGDDRCGLKGCNIARNALNLINRKNAEIENLESRIFALNDTNKILMESQEIYAKNIVKEFAERLKEMPSVTNCEYEWLVLDIDDLVKEMTEQKN